MGLLQDELMEVKKLCEHTIKDSKLVSCVETMVRVEITKTNFKKIVICMQFPKDYPNVPLLMELKSKTLVDRLLSKITDISEIELKKHLGKPQIMKLIKFIDHFITENPLCCCYNEINNLKKITSDNDELKLRQKTSTVCLKIVNNSYYLKAKVSVPNNYPEKCVSMEDLDTNFPPYFRRHMIAQAKEFGRRCVEPPLRKLKKNEPPFKPQPSLEKVVAFLVDCIKRYPTERCQICKEQCFPDDPQDVVTDEYADKHVDRLLCGHILHNGCLIKFMRTPPFGNKRCGQCNEKIYHEKWGITDRLAEDRWAHEQARERELAEVTDFFQ